MLVIFLTALQPDEVAFFYLLSGTSDYTLMHEVTKKHYHKVYALSSDYYLQAIHMTR